MTRSHVVDRAPRPRPDAVRIRKVDPLDAAGLSQFYANLSPESRRRRFLGYAAGIPVDRSRAFCTPDHDHDEGFVAVIATDDAHDGRIVGHLCLVPAVDASLELAVAVADEVQRQGIGRRLFEEALCWARERGTRMVTATAFADNGQVLKLLSSAPKGARVTLRNGLAEVDIPLE